jgi:nicotinamidase-related amidase
MYFFISNVNKIMKTALLLIDIQNDYFENGTMTLSGSLEASKNAALIIEQFRSLSLPIVYIQHLALSPTATFFLPGTHGAELHESIRPKTTEKIIVKHYPNSFYKTELLEYLQSLEISDLVICGMMTQMCVDATTRAAKDFGYNCTLIGDACATKDLHINGQSVKAADVQTSFLAALNGYYSNVIMANQFGCLKDLS